MRKLTEISAEELKKIVNEFYAYFETGYAFEEFLKIYLEHLGLDEVKVTQRSRDGGVDLTAKRNGVGGFSDADEINYYVQAKRNKPASTVSVSKIRELKGVIPFGHKGIFITTARYSDDAIKESNNDPSKPVTLIDGKTLVESCIEHEIGFIFTPKFSKLSMDKLTERYNETQDNLEADCVEKQITMNDIRSRIMPIPKSILDKIPADAISYKVIVNNETEKELAINRIRKYFGGITEIYKKYGLIDEDGVFHPQKTVWYWNDGILKIIISGD